MPELTDPRDDLTAATDDLLDAAGTALGWNEHQQRQATKILQAATRQIQALEHQPETDPPVTHIDHYAVCAEQRLASFKRYAEEEEAKRHAAQQADELRAEKRRREGQAHIDALTASMMSR